MLKLGTGTEMTSSARPAPTLLFTPFIILYVKTKRKNRISLFDKHLTEAIPVPGLCPYMTREQRRGGVRRQLRCKAGPELCYQDWPGPDRDRFSVPFNGIGSLGRA